jgi:hypothetical protein
MATRFSVACNLKVEKKNDGQKSDKIEKKPPLKVLWRMTTDYGRRYGTSGSEWGWRERPREKDGGRGMGGMMMGG